MILHYHAKEFHSGITHTLVQVRQIFWFAQGRNAVKKAPTRKYCECRRWLAKSFKLPRFPDYPAKGLGPSRVFENVGLDYACSLKIKGAHREEERWICLWTYFTTRAIHLGLATNLSDALRRLFARRSEPSLVYSDNSAQFNVAE